MAVGQHLAALLAGRTSPYDALDGLGVPIGNAPRRGSGWLAGQAAMGRGTRVGWDAGLHVLTAVTPLGAITGYGCAPASTKDQRLAETFLALRQAPQPSVSRVGTPARGVYGDGVDAGFAGRTWHTAHPLGAVRRRHRHGPTQAQRCGLLAAASAALARQHPPHRGDGP